MPSRCAPCLLAAAILLTGLWGPAAGPAGAAPVVLFDQGHGQRFIVERRGELDLSGLGALLQEAGAEVRSHPGPLTPGLLAAVDALVVSGPFVPYTMEEVRAVNGFLVDGGRVALMLHIAPSAVPLLQAFNVAASSGVVHEQEQLIGDRSLDFRVTRLEPHPLTAGLTGFAVYGAWAVSGRGDNAAVIARTGPRAWLDLDRDRSRSAAEVEQAFGLAVAGRVGRGRFVVFGDDAIFQNRFLRGDNEQLGRNLAHWLSGTGASR